METLSCSMVNGGKKMRKKIDNNPDAYEINKVLNKHRRKDDQLPTYDQEQGMFVKGNKKGALSDFEILDAYKNAKEEDKKLFEPMLNRLAKKPSAADNWNAIHKSMTPKERREFYKDKKEKPKDMYDDIPKVHMPPMQVDLKIAENFAEKNLEKQIEEERFKKIMERKEDPDLQKGLGSITYKLNKD